MGVGLPNLLSIGGMLKLTSYLGAGVNMGFIPSTKISLYGDATLSYQEYDVYGRLFPFGGGFFLGAGVGYATVKGTLTQSFDPTQLSQAGAAAAAVGLPNPMVYESQGSVRTLVLTPQVGYFYTTAIGLSLGLDLGAQVPIAPSDITYDSKLSLPADTPAAVKDAIAAQYVTPSDNKVESTLQKMGRAPLPTLNLRVGWLF